MQYSIKDFLSKQNKNLNECKCVEKDVKDVEKNIKKDVKDVEKEIPKENNKIKNQPTTIGKIGKREQELMRMLYSELNTTLYPFVLEVLNEYEFIGSPMYNTIGIDKETLSQMVDRVINLAEESLDEIGEVKNGREPYSKTWNKWEFLRNLIESLLLNDIFSIRRPNYYSNFAPNIF